MIFSAGSSLIRLYSTILVSTARYLLSRRAFREPRPQQQEAHHWPHWEAGDGAAKPGSPSLHGLVHKPASLHSAAGMSRRCAWLHACRGRDLTPPMPGRRPPGVGRGGPPVLAAQSGHPLPGPKDTQMGNVAMT